MKTKNANVLRERWTAILKETLEQLNEDVGQIASNCINFPVVAEDGEEGFIEILIKVPKSDDGFEKREDYQWKLEEQERRKKEEKEKKKKKIERDQKRREEMKRKQEEGKGE